MPSLRARVPLHKSHSRNIRALAYLYDHRRGTGYPVPTTIPYNESSATPRFPSFEAVFGTDCIIDETLVTVHGPGGHHTFIVAARHDADLPVNAALCDLLPDVEWHGELLVMRQGEVVLVKELGRRDIAETAVKKYLLEVCFLMSRAKEEGTDFIMPLIL